VVHEKETELSPVSSLKKQGCVKIGVGKKIRGKRQKENKGLETEWGVHGGNWSENVQRKWDVGGTEEEMVRFKKSYPSFLIGQ